jgi:hypothetical protein
MGLDRKSDDAHLAGMTIIDVALGALIANFLVVLIFYGLWRLTRNERDKMAMFITFVGFAAVAVIGIAAR